MKHRHHIVQHGFVLLALAVVGSGCALTGTPASTDDQSAPPVIQAQVTVAQEETTGAPAQAASANPPDDPEAALKAAIEAKDYAALQALMAPDFGFGLIASEGRSYTPAEFVVQLQETYLGPGAVQVDLARDVPGEVSSDYQSLVESYAHTLYSTGWGTGQADTALLFLNEQGQWSGMLYMFEGLEQEVGLFAATGQSQASGQPPAQESAAAPPEGVNNQALGPFQEALLAGISTERDYARLQSLMGDPFVIGYWQSEGVELTPPAAAEELRTNLLPPDAFVSYTLSGDLSGMLGGQDPLDMWGPGVNAVRAIHSTGWGTDGKGEAIIIIAQRADRTYYWHSLLYAPQGF